MERYDRAVYHLALRTLRDAEEAKDAAQETFFKAFRSLHTYRPQKQLLHLDFRDLLPCIAGPDHQAQTD